MPLRGATQSGKNALLCPAEARSPKCGDDIYVPPPAGSPLRYDFAPTTTWADSFRHSSPYDPAALAISSV